MKFDVKKLKALNCSKRDIEFLMKLEPILKMVEKGVPITRAAISLYDESANLTVKNLLSRGKALAEEGAKVINLYGEDKCALLFYNSYVYLTAKLINDMTDIIYLDAKKNKNWKAAAELLKMRFAEFNAKSGLGENLGDISGQTKIEVKFIDATSNENQIQRLEMLENQAKKDVA